MVATLTVSPSGAIKPGTVLTVYGSAVPSKTFVMLVWNSSTQTPKIRTSPTGGFDTTFTVPSSMPAGTYTLSCRVLDTGVTVATTSVIVQTTIAATVPGVPINLSAVPASTAITLTWSAPVSNGGSAVTGYKVYQTVGGGSPTVVATLGSVLTYQKTGLTNGTQYYYQVSALNSVGEGAKSVSVFAIPNAYTFFDDFTGDLSKWGHHFNFLIGSTKLWDPANARVNAGNLEMLAVRRNDLGGFSGSSIDTSGKFTQKYGIFEVKAKVAKGKGLFPAPLWLYVSGSGWENELDVVEILSNPIGANGGNDVSLVHAHVIDETTRPGFAYRTVDTSLDYHIYGMEWRADFVAFLFDGVEYWRYTDASHISDVAMPLIIDHAIGGSWASEPDSTTPDTNIMYVDWVRVSA